MRRAWIVYVGKNRSLSFLGGDCSVEHFAVRLLLLDFAWALVAALSDYAPEWDEVILYHLTVHFVSLLPPKKGRQDALIFIVVPLLDGPLKCFVIHPSSSPSLMDLRFVCIVIHQASRHGAGVPCDLTDKSTSLPNKRAHVRCRTMRSRLVDRRCRGPARLRAKQAGPESEAANKASTAQARAGARLEVALRFGLCVGALRTDWWVPCLA